MYTVYILYSKKLDQYYKGQTDDLEKRLDRHNSGYENSTSRGVPWDVIWTTTKPTRGEALILERKLKNLNRVKLEAFIKKYRGGSSQDE